MYLQPDIQIRHSAFGVGYPQVNSLLDFGDDNVIMPQPDHYLVSEPFLGLSGEVEYHEFGHCLYMQGWGTFYEGEIEAIVNFPYAHVS